MEVYSTDNYCGGRGVAQTHLAPAALEIALLSSAEAALVSLQPLESPPGKTPCVIESKSEKFSLANHACKLVTTDAKKAAQEMGIPGTMPAVRMDTEWEVWTSGPHTTATAQVSSLPWGLHTCSTCEVRW